MDNINNEQVRVLILYEGEHKNEELYRLKSLQYLFDSFLYLQSIFLHNQIVISQINSTLFIMSFSILVYTNNRVLRPKDSKIVDYLRKKSRNMIN